MMDENRGLIAIQLMRNVRINPETGEPGLEGKPAGSPDLHAVSDAPTCAKVGKARWSLLPDLQR